MHEISKHSWGYRVGTIGKMELTDRYMVMDTVTGKVVRFEGEAVIASLNRAIQLAVPNRVWGNRRVVIPFEGYVFRSND